MRTGALALLLSCALSLGAQDSGSGVHPVVLISIDGLKPQYVLDADAHGLRIPNLRALVADGAHASGVVGVVPTVTYPSHTTLVTGVAPARHGIITNTTFDPLHRNQGGWYWYASDIAVPTLWDAVMDAGRTTGNVHWPVTVGARITWNLPQYWRTGTLDDRKLERALSTPGLYDELEASVGRPYADGIDESIEGDERRAIFAEQMIERKKPALMLAYFTALDHEQHHSGPFSPAALATLERIDAIVGRMHRAAERVYGPTVVFAVASDHGFERTDHAVNLVGAFRAAHLIDYASAASDTVVAWRAAIWPGGGSAAVVLRDSTDTVTREQVAALLQALAADSSSGVDRIVGREELRRRGGFPGATFLVNLRAGYTFGADSRGPLVVAAAPGGMHGYMPDAPAMRTSFLITGPGIPAGMDFGLIDQRAIAPTLAKFLGVTLPRAEASSLIR